MLSMNVNKIITRALKLVRSESIYSQENQDARQFVLDTLNDILAAINLDARLVPFVKSFDFTMTPSVGVYIIGTSIDSTIVMPYTPAQITYVNLIMSSYSFPVTMVDAYTQKDSTRPLEISGQPYQVRVQQQEDSFLLDFFPKPSQAYLIRIFYKSNIANAEYGGLVDLPIAYRAYLTYELAKRIDLENTTHMWDEKHESKLRELENQLYFYTDTDIRIRSQPPMFHYGRVFSPNLGVIR